MKVAVLSGGVGGARFLRGVAAALPPEDVTAIVNTGDDFDHWGLRICPDLDTVLYGLAGLSHEERGWGLAEESFHALGVVERLGGDAWFALGDRDLGLHLVRTERLRRGATLSEVTADCATALGVRTRIVPMTDAPRPTLVETRAHGTLSFQDWFVRLRTEPEVARIRFEGSPAPTPGALEAIASSDLVLVGPSNLYVSIEPILSLPGMREALARRPVVAVSPIVGGNAIKGPLARMIRDLAGEEASAGAVARAYGPLLHGYVVERGDEAGISVPVLATETVMRTREEAARLAREVLAFAARLG